MSDEKPIAFPPKDPSIPAPDGKAEKEDAGMKLGVDLSSQRALNQFDALKRQGKIDGHLHLVTCWAIYLIGAALIVCILVIITSYLIPKAWSWFDPDQIAKLREFIFTGALGAALNEGRKRITKDGMID